MKGPESNNGLERTMRNKCKDVSRAVFLQGLGSHGKGLARVDHIIYENGNL